VAARKATRLVDRTMAPPKPSVSESGHAMCVGTAVAVSVVVRPATSTPAADPGFGLPAPELAGINRWLIVKSCKTLAAVLAFMTLLKVVALPELPLGRIVALCAFALALAPLYWRWLASGRALGALIYTQFAADIAVITFALASIPELSVLFHMQFLLVIVPCALLSPACGMVMAIGSIGAHLLLAALRVPPPTLVDVLAPVYFYAMVAHQCFFYGRRMRDKTREAESSSTIAAALLELARGLAAAPTSVALLQTLATRARDLTHAEWAAVVMRDPTHGTSQIAGLVSRTGTIDDELLSWEFQPGDLPDRLIAAAHGDGFVDTGVHPPPGLDQRWRIGPFMAAVMRRAGEPLGLLLVGSTAPGGTFDSLTRPLLTGMAQQAVLALDNARLLDDVRAASEVKSEFIGAMSHELRSPLHAIIGYTDILEEMSAESGEGAVAERREMLARSRMYSRQLLDLIDATLDLSRLEAGRLPVSSAPIALAAFFSDLREGVPSYWLRATVAFEWDVPPILPAAWVDARKVATIVRNLVHNALKFTDAGKVAVRVRIEEARARTACCIVVSDTGVGIAPNLLPVVFDMFRQGDGSDSRRHEGVGLGLHIAKRLVELLGGTIAVDSEVGRGTTFAVTIPLRLIQPAAPSSSEGDCDDDDGFGDAGSDL
jgi:signal transduction histidine kinase